MPAPMIPAEHGWQNPTSRPSRPRHVGGDVAPYLAALVLLVATLVSCGSDQVSTRPAATPADPAVIAVAQGQSTFPPATTSGQAPTNAGSGRHLKVRSALTGTLIRDLGVDPGAITLSADGSTIYYEAASGPLDPFAIERVSVAGGQPVTVASGEDPAISPDGSSLAYATGDGHAVAIENVIRHTIRRVELGPLIGTNASFNNTPGVVTWLGDDRLVAIPPQDASFYTTSPPKSSPAPTANPSTCTAAYQQRQQCAIVIDTTATTSAHLVVLPARQPFAIVSAGAGMTPNTFLIGSAGSVSQFTLGATTATADATLAVPGRGLVVGFSPSGHQLLYLQNHGPIQLWVGIIANTITPARELLANADLGSASW